MVLSGVFYIPRSRSLPTGPAKTFSPCAVVIGNLTRRGFLEDDQDGRRLRYVLPSIRICTSASEEPGKDLAPFGAFTPSNRTRTPLKTLKEFPHPTGIEARGEGQIAANQRNINYETHALKVLRILLLPRLRAEVITSLCERSTDFSSLSRKVKYALQAAPQRFAAAFSGLQYATGSAAQPHQSGRVVAARRMVRTRSVLRDVWPTLDSGTPASPIPQTEGQRGNTGNVFLATHREDSLNIQLSLYEYPTPAQQRSAARCAHNSEPITDAADTNLLPGRRHSQPTSPRPAPAIRATLSEPLCPRSGDTRSSSGIAPQATQEAHRPRREGGSHE